MKKLENITLNDMVRFCQDLGFDVKIAFKKNPKYDIIIGQNILRIRGVKNE